MTFLAIQNLNGKDVTPAKRGRRPADLPLLTSEDGTLLPRYEVEKRTGLRKTNGTRKLRRLTHRHHVIIAKHICGNSSEDIAAEIGCTVVTVSRILHDPLAENIIQAIYKVRQKEIDALAGDAIAVVRSTLQDVNVDRRIKLAAVDRFTKLKEVLTQDISGPETAEDVIKRMLERNEILNITDSQVVVNIGGKE